MAAERIFALTTGRFSTSMAMMKVRNMRVIVNEWRVPVMVRMRFARRIRLSVLGTMVRTMYVQVVARRALPPRALHSSRLLS